MKYRFLVLALIAITFTGCYTSFSPRDYEEESYGRMDNYYYDSSDVAMNIDSTEYYYPEEEYYYDDPLQEVTVINNYGPDWGWGYYSPYYSRIYTNYGCYDPFYDPFYDPYCYPYYRPYYAYGYGSFYTGHGYGSGYYNYPSSVRYRTNRSHWTSVRNNGGRSVVTRGRDTNRGGGTLNKDMPTRDNFRTVKGFDLDRDLQVSKIASNSRSSNNSGLRTAGYTRDSNSRRKVKRTTDLERRRISNKSKNNEVVRDSKDSQDKRTQEVTKNPRVNNNNNSSSKRSKRVYSSNSDSRRSKLMKTSTRTYYNPPSRSSKSSSSSSGKSKSSGYSSSRSSNSNSSGYSSSRNSSRSSSSRSSVSRSSGSSSSRSSVSRSSGSSSSRSSGSRSSSSSRSSSGSSSRRR